METDLVEKKLKLLEIKWNTLHWHKETVKVLMNKVEKGALSGIKEPPRASMHNIENNINLARKKYTDVELEDVYADATKATKEQLESRREHFYLTIEYLDTLANIEATARLVAEYSKHVTTTNEEIKFISPAMAVEMFKEIDGLGITNKEQLAILEGLRNEFNEKFSEFPMEEKFEFYTLLDNLYNDNC